MGGGFTNLYTSGDVVLRNPRESAAIFVFVITLSIVLEKMFHYLRHNHHRYIRLIFAQVSEELQSVGLISLAIMFFASSIVSALPDNWFLLFEWTHMVLFFMMMFFVMGVIFIVAYLQRVMRGWEKMENDLVKEETEGATASDATRTSVLNNFSRTRGFVRTRNVFQRHLKIRYDNRLSEEALKKISFAMYLTFQTQTAVVKFVEITWQTWVSLIGAAVVNSVREYALPGKLQSKDADEYSSGDRLLNLITFDVIMGYIPLVVLCVTTYMIKKKNDAFLDEAELSVKRQQSRSDMNELVADLKTPADAFFRRNELLTTHLVKIPVILLEFYFSAFIMGLLYSAAVHISEYRYLIFPLTVTPPLLSIILMPTALMNLTMLTTVICPEAIDHATVLRVAKKIHKKEEKKRQKLLGTTHNDHGHGHGGHDEHEEHDHHGGHAAPPFNPETAAMEIEAALLGDDHHGHHHHEHHHRSPHHHASDANEHDDNDQDLISEFEVLKKELLMDLLPGVASAVPNFSNQNKDLLSEIERLLHRAQLSDDGSGRFVSNFKDLERLVQCQSTLKTKGTLFQRLNSSEHQKAGLGV
eukprot:PhM_4_TR15705/c0_g1_i1/m.84948